MVVVFMFISVLFSAVIYHHYLFGFLNIFVSLQCIYLIMGTINSKSMRERERERERERREERFLVLLH